MSFADELRKQQQIQQATKRYSDEDVYQKILINTFTELKTFIKGNISNNSTNILSGEYLLYESRCRCCLGPSELINRESPYHIVVPDEYGPVVDSKPLCETKTKYVLTASFTKVVLTRLGQRLTEDLIIMGKNEGIKIWFTPRFIKDAKTKDLSMFDKYENLDPYMGSFYIILHYEIEL